MLVVVQNSVKLINLINFCDVQRRTNLSSCDKTLFFNISTFEIQVENFDIYTIAHENMAREILT